MKGAHAITHVLIRRLAGFGTKVEIPREQWMTLPPDEHLKMTSDKSGNVTLIVEQDK